MATVGSIPESVKTALDSGALHRLPVTFLPFVNQQLHEWDYLFPNERQSVERLLSYVVSLSADESAAMFRPVIDLEDKMEVRKWKFSTAEQTIENASLLARSPYYQDWRKAVQSVFDAADQYARTTGSAQAAGNRLVLLDIPRPLAIDAADPWRRWQKIGRPIDIDVSRMGGSNGALEYLLTASQGVGGDAKGLLAAMKGRSGNQVADTWLIDAGQSLVGTVAPGTPAGASGSNPILLSYPRLDRYRQSFSHEMNTMRKDLADADAVYDRLRKVDVKPWCPPEAEDPAVREYLRSLYLSGNGAVIFSNSFVQWGSSEALRRARPRFLVARFGMRSKPKPFTGVAVFENPDQINPLPSVDDIPGSSVDAQILALYVWLSAARFSEYQSSTVCVCIAESLSQAYLVAPPQFAISPQTSRLSIDELGSALHQWMTSDAPQVTPTTAVR